MAPRLKPLKDPEELSAVPLSEPVMVELEVAKTGQEEAPETEKPVQQDDGVKTLQDQLEAAKRATQAAQEQAERERKARTEAERTAAERTREVEQARSRAADTESDMIDSGLASAQRDMDAAKAAVRTAFEAGDPAALAEAQAKVGRAAADIRDFERAAAELADRKERSKQEEPPRQERQLSPEEAIDANPGLMPAERTWLKEHMDAVLDQARNNELGVAYNRATKKGLVRGSPEYFKFIDEFMGYAKPAQSENEDESIVSAPVSRENRTPSGQVSGSRIILTPEQREFARTMGLSDVQYAQQVRALQQDKKANPDKYGMRG